MQLLYIAETVRVTVSDIGSKVIFVVTVRASRSTVGRSAGPNRNHKITYVNFISLT